VFDLDADEVMDQLSNDLLAHGDLQRALREMMRRGLRDSSGRNLPGLRELLKKLQQQRQQQLQRYNLDSALDDLKQRLKDVVDTERQGIQQRLEEAAAQTETASGQEREQRQRLMKLLEQRAQRSREALDTLPDSLGGAVKELSGYEFISPEAQAKFKELLDLLKGRMMESFSKEMRDRLKNLTPEQMAAMREMMRQLNQMMKDKASGRQPNFQGFMQQFGPLFGPDQPQSLEELMERLQRQAAQMQSLLDSMSPESRRELFEALNAAIDPETQRELAEFGALMDQLMPIDELRRRYPFMGDESLTLDRAMELMQRLQEMDELQSALEQAARTGKPGDVDTEKLQELLGEDARRSWDALNQLQKLLEEAGYIKAGQKLELTPRGIRRIGQKALRELFMQLKRDRQGDHRMDQRGVTGDTIEETKPYEFGDPFQVHLEGTVKNALARQGPHVPVKLRPEDFEIYRNEHFTRSATVLLLDQSRSMGLFGSFVAAKKVALAMYALIHGQFARDTLHVIGFSDYAQEIKEEELPHVSWNAWVSGTNIHHALMLSRKLLSREKTPNRQIILITDGEPTAHLEGDRSFFSYPPTYRTLMETLKEVRRCTQDGITINSFMLESNYQLVDFIDQMTRINRGR
ncbi:MAG: VWA domain-containing protein, partial [Chloroflexota bacterium]|nr:VWA domain-containing protein [Chloroflexota bacterium]